MCGWRGAPGLPVYPLPCPHPPIPHHPQVGHRSGKTAPFGLDPTNAPYVTEQARPNGTGGPRGQQMSGSSPPRREPALGGREGASGGVLSGFDHLQRQAAAAQSQPALPGAIAQSLYDRDVNKVGSAAPHPSSFVYSPPGTAGGGVTESGANVETHRPVGPTSSEANTAN